MVAAFSHDTVQMTAAGKSGNLLILKDWTERLTQGTAGRIVGLKNSGSTPLSKGIMGAAARMRRAQLVNDVASDPRYVTPPGTPGARAELAVPMLYGDELLGLVNAEGDGPFDELDRNPIGTFDHRRA